MRLFYNNLIDGAAVVITPGSEHTAFPARNLANPLRSKPYRTLATFASETVTFDLGSAQLVQACILLDHDLQATDTVLRIYGNATDTWGAPSYSGTLIWSAGPIALLTGNQTYRYWRLAFTKDAAGEVRNIGRMHLGPYLQGTERPSYTGFERAPQDLSTTQMTVGGQDYSSARDQYRMINLDFDTIPQAELDAVTTFYQHVGIHSPFFVVAQEGGGGELDEYLYVRLKSLPKPKVGGFDASLIYEYSLDFKEQL